MTKRWEGGLLMAPRMRLLPLLTLLLSITTKSALSSEKTNKDLVGPPNCPPHYYGDKGTARCYGFPQKDPKEAKTWVDAEKACRNQGGLLTILSATPDGAKVLKFLREEAIKRGIHGAWVAANDGKAKNGFHWLDDSPVSPSGHLKYYEKYPEPHDGPSWWVVSESQKLWKPKSKEWIIEKNVSMLAYQSINQALDHGINQLTNEHIQSINQSRKNHHVFDPLIDWLIDWLVNVSLDEKNSSWFINIYFCAYTSESRKATEQKKEQYDYLIESHFFLRNTIKATSENEQKYVAFLVSG